MVNFNLKEAISIQSRERSRLGGYFEPIADVMTLQQNGLDYLISAAHKLDKLLNSLIQVVNKKFTKPDYEAIAIFKQILYWYSPIYELDSEGNKIYKQKFAGDHLQKSYAQLSREINLSVPTIKRAVKRLVDAGWLFMSHLTVETNQGDKFSNQTHFAINIVKLNEIFKDKKEEKDKEIISTSPIEPELKTIKSELKIEEDNIIEEDKFVYDGIEEDQVKILNSDIEKDQVEITNDGMKVDQLEIPGLATKKEVVKSNKPNKKGKLNWQLTESQRQTILYWYNEILFSDKETWVDKGMGAGQPFNEDIKNKWVKHEKFYLDWDKAITKIVKSRYNDNFEEFVNDFKRCLVMIPNNYFWSNPTRSAKFGLLALLNSQNNNDSICIMARKYEGIRDTYKAKLPELERQEKLKKIAAFTLEQQRKQEQEQEQNNNQQDEPYEMSEEELADYIETLRSVGIELED